MDSLPLQILVQIILILVNAFFAASEIAVLSLNKTKLRHQAENGDKVAKRLLKFAETPAGFLSTIQIGITLAGFLGSAFAAENFSDRLTVLIYDTWGFQALSRATIDTISVIVITLILSYFTLVFGELVPKRIAMQKSYAVAKFSSRVISALAVVMRPVIWLLSKSTNLILKIFRMKVEAEDEQVTEEEIKMMVDLGEETGTVEEKEKEWIKNIFEFNDTTVKEIMTPSYAVKFIKTSNSLTEAEEIIKTSKKSRFPVCKNSLNDIVGILHIKDFFTKEFKSIEEILRPVEFVPETTLADDLFNRLQKTKNSFAVVVDEYGVSTGIVTMEDLLEEIVGNIYDEHDQTEKAKFVLIDENTCKVAGDLLVDDLKEQFEVEIEDDDSFDTVAGLVLSYLDYVPQDGSTFSITRDNLEYEVKKVEKHRITEIIIRKNIDKSLDIEENN